MKTNNEMGNVVGIDVFMERQIELLKQKLKWNKIYHKKIQPLYI